MLGRSIRKFASLSKIVVCLVLGFYILFTIPQLPSDKYGYIDKTGRVVIQMSPLVCLGPFQEGVGCVQDVPGDVEPLVNFIEPLYHGNWLPGRCWFINTSGRVAISPRKPEMADSFSEGLAGVYIDFKWGFIDHSGTTVIAPQFAQARGFRGGLARVMSNGKWGYIDRSGRQIIEPRFDGAISFSEGLAAVLYRGKIGFIDTKGAFAVQPRFDYAGAFSEGLAFVMDQSRKFTGYIDKSGNIALSLQFDPTQIGTQSAQIYNLLSDFPLDKSLTSQPEKFGTYNYIMRTTGFTDFRSFSNGLAVFRKGNSYGYIDRSGKIIIEPKFDFAFPFSNNRAAVIKSGKFGYIDKSGHLMVGTMLQCASRFSEGLAAVELDGKWGYIDSKGTFVIAPKFQRAYPFSEGLATVGDPAI